MSDHCPECGEELDDYMGCACALAVERKPPGRPAKKRAGWTMRDMVARKLGRKARTDGKA